MHDWYQSSTSTVNACIGAAGLDGLLRGTGTEAIPARRRVGGVVVDMLATGAAEDTPRPSDVQTGLAPPGQRLPKRPARGRWDLAGRGATADRATPRDTREPAVRSVGGGRSRWENHPMTSQPWTLVTGGAGYIGSLVVDDLLARGTPVRVLDTLLHGSVPSLLGAWGRPGFEF